MKPRTRTGKIARLPRGSREALNRRLENGAAVAIGADGIAKMRATAPWRAHLDTATGAPASGPAGIEFSPKRAGSEIGAPQLPSEFAAVSRCAPLWKTLQIPFDRVDEFVSFENQPRNIL
jgi:hypothetical protein